MDKKEKTAALEESEPLASLDASRSGRPEKSGREEQPSFARGFGRARRFRIWLSEKYRVRTAYLFIGLIPKYKELYKYLQECGFTLVFKEVIYDGDGKPKGNCDADLVVQAMRDAYEDKFSEAVLVASDGDYAGLVKFLFEKRKLSAILSPHPKDRCSILLKRTGAKISYISDQRSRLELFQKEKAPDGDGTP